MDQTSARHQRQRLNADAMPRQPRQRSLAPTGFPPPLRTAIRPSKTAIISATNRDRPRTPAGAPSRAVPDLSTLDATRRENRDAQNCIALTRTSVMQCSCHNCPRRSAAHFLMKCDFRRRCWCEWLQWHGAIRVNCRQRHRFAYRRTLDSESLDGG